MTINTLDKTYEPHALESRLYGEWEAAGWFRPGAQGAPYCIMIPPPNVTGSLHMGHAFQDTIMDALIRYHRMAGHNTLWQAGTDHAGIATQMVVERQLEAAGKSRHDLGREEFIERVWEWKAQSGGTITRQLRRMGASLDWSRERFTMDTGLSHAVLEVFVHLHEQGLIYRGKRLVNWDPVLRTAVSDLEVVAEEESGHLWHIRYPLAGGDGCLVVATTRPETLLGDAAVAVHPGDERYRHLIGQLVELPLTGRHIPVIADDYVDPEFGTGCVKITPAHDFNDYAVWQRHRDTTPLQNVPHNGLINIFTTDARLKSSPFDEFHFGHRAEVHGTQLADDDGLAGAAIFELIPPKYRGLDRFEARKHLVADLDAAGLLDKHEHHLLKVPRGDRSGAVLEPYLTDQWYVKVAPLAAAAIKAVEDGRIRFVPENWTKTYYEWMRNIQDWCISRQIWWGHRIPAWYDDKGGVYVGRNEAEVRARHGLAANVQLTQDPDVLDTWFSSALWPFSTLGWPDASAELKTFYPTSVLVTGFDIIFFWVARMIMLGLKFMDDVPFREVYIHGLVRDAEGQKMSKSKGNILDPIDLIDGIDLEALVQKRTSGLMQPQMAKGIEQATRRQFADGIPAYGTDALRFTFASLATQGRDIKFDLGRIEGYRNFCNKLWNAARYVLMNTEGQDCAVQGSTNAAGAGRAGAAGQSYGDGAQAPSSTSPLPLPSPGGRGEVGENPHSIELSAADRWIVSRLQQVEAEVETGFREYRFDQVAQTLYAFVWDEYCSWYLELSKVVLTDPASSAALQRGTRRTLVRVLETLLRLLHPVMPFITETIWQKVAPLAGKTGPTIMLQPYPKAAPDRIDPAAIAEMEWTMAVIAGVRNIRGEMNIAPARPLPLLLQDGAATDRDFLARNGHYLKSLARLESVTWLEPGHAAPESATALVGNLKVLVPLGSIIDKQAELARLAREIERIGKDLARAQGKLATPSFIERAPREVVEQERRRVTDMQTALANLTTQRKKVETLAG